MKAIKVLLSSILIISFLSACAPPEVVKTVVVQGSPVAGPATVVTATPAPVDKSGGTFTWGVGDEPPGFNPILNDNGVEIVIYQLTNEPLTWGGENFPSDLRPILAESWERSADGLVWTIHLRKNVTWQDGKPFTADDVLFWAAAIQDTNTTGSEWLHGRFFVNDQPFKFEKVDDTTVKITTAAPVPDLLNNICAPLIPMHYFVDNKVANADMLKNKFNTDLNLGTGPFQMSEYRKGEAVILTRNDNYWGGKPLLDKFVLRIIPDEQARIVALQTGEIDFTQVNPKYVPDLLSDTNLQLITKVVDMQYHFRLNTTKPALSDKRTRQALFLALDREAMLEALNMGYGQIADSPFNPVVSAYESKPIYSFNVDKANQLLKDVGWVKGSDGILVAENVAGVAKGTRFTLVLDAMSTDEQKIMTMAQSYWIDLGIDATIRQIDSNVWREENIGKVDKPYDVMYSGIGFIGNNGINYQWLMATTKKDSDMSYENPDVNALFEKAKTTGDATQRDTYLKQAAAIVWDDLPFLPLYYDKRVFAANKNVHFEDSDWQVTMVGIFGKPGNIWKSK